MHVILAVFKRNFFSYLSGVIGYLFIVVFLLVCTWLAFGPEFFANNLANLDQLNLYFPYVVALLVPAITMMSWAEERRTGTDELLFTLPASDLSILTGKYLAAVGVYSVALLFAVMLVICLGLMGSPDLGLMAANFIGYWFTGSALLAAGMVASSATKSPTIAYLLGLIIAVVPVGIAFLIPGDLTLASFSVASKLEGFTLGQIPLTGVLYFLSLTAFFLFINYVLISGRHWSTGPGMAATLVLACLAGIGVPLVILLLVLRMFPDGSATSLIGAILTVVILGVFVAVAMAITNRGWRSAMLYAVEFIALGLILGSINAVATPYDQWFDLTSEQLYSLSKTTKDTISEVKPGKRVRITAFISPKVPRELADTRTTLIGLLRRFDQRGGDKVVVQIHDTERYTPAADLAKSMGIQAIPMASEERGRIVTTDVYLGVHIASGTEEVVLPFFDSGTPVEYELTRSVRTVAITPTRIKLGILRTDAKASGGFDMQTFQQTPPWRIINELKKQYDVKDVGPDELATTDVKVLLALMPSSLSERELPQLLAWVKKGGATLIIDDPLPLFHIQLSPKLDKPRQGGMMGGGAPPEPKADGGSLKQLMSLLEIQWSHTETVWDPSYNPYPELYEVLRQFDVVYVGSKSGSSAPFNKSNPITSGMQEMMLFYPGALYATKNSDVKYEPLLRVTKNSYLATWEEAVEEGGGFPFGGGTRTKEVPPIKDASGEEHVVAAYVTMPEDKVKQGKPPINCVFVADMDLVADQFFQVRDKRMHGLNLDNITFVLNAVDYLAGDDSNIELRKRRPNHRTLTRMQTIVRAQREAEAQKIRETDSGAEERLKKAKDRLKTVAEDIRANKSLSDEEKDIKMSLAVEAEQRRLTVEEAKIEADKKREINELKDQTNRAIRRSEWQFLGASLLIVPIPAVILGLIVALMRLGEESRSIIPDRQVKKRN